MQITIHLKDNKGFPWIRKDNLYIRGYIFGLDERLYTGTLLTGYFAGIRSYTDFEERIRYANGCFSVVYQDGEDVFLACDYIRSLPLFYNKRGEELVISDDPYYLLENIEKPHVNSISATEFLASGFVTGDETLIDGIQQVQAGEIVRFEKSDILKKFYFSYRTSIATDDEYDESRKKAVDIFNNAFKRFIASLEGRTVVVPLSGGYDSRLIVAMLKKYEYDKVICFTYGRAGNRDTQVSEKVAAKLGFRWIYVEYSSKLIQGYLQDEMFKSYFPYAGKLVSMFFMQEYFAVKYLKEKKLIPEDSIFAPGHSGDFLGGSQIFKHGNLNQFEDIKNIIRRLYRVKYLYKRPAFSDRHKIMDRIGISIEEKFTGNVDYSYSIHEDWDFKEKLAKFNFNSSNTYTYFGYEFRFPYWDTEVINFFRTLPLHMKINKYLYDDILTTDFFEPLNLNFDDELQPTPREIKQQQYKDQIKYRLPDYFNRIFMKKTDALFYNEITKQMVDDLAKKGKKISIHGNFYNSLIIQWYLEKTRDLVDAKGKRK
jgi:asparagine synthase (glutamine-hydrolysing)